jgi:NAD+ diphosphatase
MTPSPYPTAIDLPFNFSCISDEFEFCTPGPNPPDEEGSWVIIQGTNAVLEQTPQGLMLPSGILPEWLKPQQTALCIGNWHGKPLRAITVSSSLALAAPFVIDTFNSVRNTLDAQTLTLAGLGKQILHWDRVSLYCQRCGAATERIPSSWGKHCSACSSDHYPHLHPCAIVLVTRGDELLLTRKPEWPPGRYSLVAGFLEFGESLEECAMREVFEETGIKTTNLRYLGSQNWPFPAQLMAGFIADYAGGEVVIEKSELEDARWFKRDQLPNLPTERSIARWIIDSFVNLA